MNLSQLRRRAYKPASLLVAEEDASLLADQVLSFSSLSFSSHQHFLNPRGEWDPTLHNLWHARNFGTLRDVAEILSWCLEFCRAFGGHTSSLVSANDIYVVLNQAEDREAQFAQLALPWCKPLLKKFGDVLVSDLSPEPTDGPFYFHRVFDDVMQFLFLKENAHVTTAVEWNEVEPSMYDDAFATPLDFFKKYRGKHRLPKFVSVKSSAGWKPLFVQVWKPLACVGVDCKAGQVFWEVVRECVAVARCTKHDCSATIEKAIVFGCVLGQGTQLDQRALYLLKVSPHHQASLGRAILGMQRRQDASWIPGLFFPAGPLRE